jgi:hypothetical protein
MPRRTFFLLALDRLAVWGKGICVVTDRVALQNIENNEVPCKIFQDKELREVSASSGSYRLKSGAKRRCRDDDLKEDF